MKATAPKPTLKTLAAKAGLGRSTVGLILNGRGDELGIPAETQTRVFEVARKLGYRPNSLALGLAGKRTQTIGLLLPSGPYYPLNLMPQQISLRLHQRGYQTYLVDSLQDTEVILEALGEMAARQVDGIVFFAKLSLPPAVRKAVNQFPAAVLVTNHPIQQNDVRPQIVYLNIAPAIDEIVDHFARTGRTRPMIVTRAGINNDEKIEPFLDALRRHGFDTSRDAAVFDIGDNDLPPDADYYTLFLKAFASKHLDNREFDALFCTCDEGAVALIKYLTERGLRVPEDVAVVGLNNTPIIQGINPPLASISWRHVEAFDRIEKRLVERLKHPDAPPGFDEIPLQFVCRESAG